MNNLNLKENIFSDKPDMKSIREGFGEGLLEAGKLNEKVVGLCADLTESTKMNLFADAFPDRFIQVGVAEQNMVTVASGMASMGKIPFVSSYAMFSPGRNWEQIRTTIAYNNMPVKIIGSHAGISVGPDGGTHQALEDIALMRVIPRMVVISPCDAEEAKKATIAISETKDPTYIRLGREKTPIITTPSTPFLIGKAQVFYQSKEEPEVVIFATGSLVYEALLAARDLEKVSIGVVVINMSTIKPLDNNAILNWAKRTKAVVTVEEHQIAGGLGSAISEFLSANFPVPIEFVGIKNDYGQSGTSKELIKHYQLDSKSIFDAANKVINRKSI